MAHFWHGFESYLNLAKAMASLGLVVVGGVWAVLVFALDGRYAPIEVTSEVEKNGVVIRSVETQVGDLADTVNQVQMAMVRRELLEVKELSCKAQTADSKSFYTREMERLVNEYRNLEDDRDPFLPKCEDF